MKNLVSVILCLCILFALIIGSGGILQSDGVNKGVDSICSFHSLPKETVEVVVLGSSRAHNGVDVMELYERYGIAAYNYANSWQRINTTALFLSDALRTQRLKVVLIETGSINAVLSNVEMEGEIAYTRALPWTKEKISYLKRCFGAEPGRYLSYIFPLFCYHENWSDLRKENFTFDKNAHNDLEHMGYAELGTGEQIVIANDGKTSQLPLTEEAKAVLDGMTACCREYGADILFFTTPDAYGFPYRDAVEEYAAENGCGYLNFYEVADKIGMDGAADYFDSVHLSKSGAGKLGAYLGEYLSERYAFKDMRTVEGNPWAR